MICPYLTRIISDVIMFEMFQYVVFSGEFQYWMLGLIQQNYGTGVGQTLTLVLALGPEVDFGTGPEVEPCTGPGQNSGTGVGLNTDTGPGIGS